MNQLTMEQVLSRQDLLEAANAVREVIAKYPHFEFAGLIVDTKREGMLTVTKALGSTPQELAQLVLNAGHILTMDGKRISQMKSLPKKE